MSRSTTKVKGALTRLKPEVALYVGGMGHRTKNFHKRQSWSGRGFRRRRQAHPGNCTSRATRPKPSPPCPTSGSILKSLVGPPARIRERYRAWEDGGRGFAQRAIGPARGHRGDGQGRAAELSRERGG